MVFRFPRCHRALATVVVLVVCAPSAPFAHAQPRSPMQAPVAQRAMVRDRGEMGMRGPPRADERSLSDAVRRVQRTTGGHILGAERVPFDGRDINRVKYMDERGRVRYMDDPVQHRSQPRPPRSDMSSLRGDNP